MKIANAVMGVNKDSVTGSGGGMNLRQYYCEKCDLTVNSQTQLDQHLLSQKHKLKGTESTNGQSKRKRGAVAGHVGTLLITFDAADADDDDYVDDDSVVDDVPNYTLTV